MNEYPYAELQAQTGRFGPHIVKLLFASPRFPSQGALVEALRTGGERVDVVGDAMADVFGVAFPDRATSVTPSHMITLARAKERSTELEAALVQTWDWPAARDAVSRATAVLTVADMMAYDLERDVRLWLLKSTIRALIHIAQPLAIHWLPSGRVVNPKGLFDNDLPHNPISSAAVNVRLFRVEGQAEGECLMDTLGMAGFGLPDLQHRFVGDDLRAVSARLFGCAAYLFVEGDVIKEGHTIDGAVPGSVWRCRRDVASVAPKREVLDLV